jgi:hypothetical protein
MVTSIKRDRACDRTCVLNAGDHPFIDRSSYVLYRLAQHSPSGHIGKMVDKQYYSQKDDFTDAIYNRIRDGLYDSDETRLAILKYAEKLKI